MSLSEIDRQLLDRCLENQPKSWEAFIDRFLGLVVHVVDHTSSAQGRQASATERDDLVNEVFLTLIENDRAVLRRFRRQSSLATYLTVVARRVTVHALTKSRKSPASSDQVSETSATAISPNRAVDNTDQLEHLMQRLDPKEADAVRMHHLEGKTYREIGDRLGMAENSIGPMLTRAKAKMRDGQAADSE